jgi:ankyrin repeat protein
MLRRVLSPSGKVHASVASFNNHWGVPLTLARMPLDTYFGVFEVGMNHPDEIRPLVKMVRPHIAVVTLIAAAHLGHAEVVKMLIAAKAPLNHVNNLGWTALMEAIVLGNGGAGHTATVHALVEAGCDVNIADRQGITPLQHARRRGYVEMARILENAGAR